jgi:hypothetical protein
LGRGVSKEGVLKTECLGIWVGDVWEYGVLNSRTGLSLGGSVVQWNRYGHKVPDLYWAFKRHGCLLCIVLICLYTVYVYYKLRCFSLT